MCKHCLKGYVMTYLNGNVIGTERDRHNASREVDDKPLKFKE